MKKIILIIILGFLAGTFILVAHLGKKETKPVKKLAAKKHYLVAIVIDDWGYNKRYTDLLSEIHKPLTLSILPNLYYSRYIANIVREENMPHDIILHLPIESKTGYSAEKNTLKSSMQKEEILKILNEDLQSVPGIIGVSNHQGSKGTEHERLMNIILSSLKEKGMFFLDSATSPKSICSRVAHKVGIRFAQRDVFLDITNESNPKNIESYVIKQLDRLSNVALKKGKAIGVGHNMEVTLRAIKDYIPEFEKRGIKIVPLRELVR